MKRLALLFAFFVAGISINSAAILTVTSNANSGTGSLRDAIVAAAGGDTIQFALSYPATITLATQLGVNKDLSILGPGRDSLSISGNDMVRVFAISPGRTVLITGLTLTNGRGNEGGALRNYGNLTLRDCRIQNSKAETGGGIYNENARLELLRCQVTGNSLYTGNTGAGGGGITNSALNNDTARAIISYSEISYNVVDNGARIGGGISNLIKPIQFFPGVCLLEIDHSTIHHNRIDYPSLSMVLGAGIYSSPDAGAGGDIEVYVTNSTLSGNISGNSSTSIALGGGLYVGNIVSSPNPATALCEVSYSTITENEAVASGNAIGGGLFFEGNVSVQIEGCLIADNKVMGSNANAPDVSGANNVTSQGNNVVGIAESSSSFNQPTDQKGSSSNPLEAYLQPLGDYGGLTPTHALGACSPAIDKGGAGAPALDQRDSARIGTADVGAVEFNPATTSGSFALAGTATQPNGSPLASTWVYLIAFAPSDSTLSALDSAQTDANGAFSFSSPQKEVYVKAAPDSASYPNTMPTYYDSALVFQDAAALNLCQTDSIGLVSLAGGNPGGPGFIGGLLVEGANKMEGDPIAGLTLLLVDPATGQALDWLKTGSDGRVSFANVPLGTYEIWVDYPFVNNDTAPEVTLTAARPSLDSLIFVLNTTYLEIQMPSVGLEEALWEAGKLRIFPNPARELLYIEIDAKASQPLTLELCDMAGRLCRALDLRSGGPNELNLGDLPAGMYMYAVKEGGMIRGRGKLRIQHH